MLELALFPDRSEQFVFGLHSIIEEDLKKKKTTSNVKLQIKKSDFWTTSQFSETLFKENSFLIVSYSSSKPNKRSEDA